MHKIKEHRNLEGQIGDGQLAPAEGAFSRGTEQGGGFGNRAAPFPSYLSARPFPLISAAPRLALREARIKARVSQRWQISAASREARLVRPGWPARPLGCWRPCALQEQQPPRLALGEAAPSVVSGISDAISVSML